MSEERYSALAKLLMLSTQEEVKLVLATDFLADGALEFAGVFPESWFDWSSPGEEEAGHHKWYEVYRRIVRWYHMERGYEWEWMEVHDTGSITPRFSGYEPRNQMYELMLAQNVWDRQSACEAAAGIAREQGWGDLEGVFREAARMVEQSVEWARAETDEEVMRSFEKTADAALASIGVLRKDAVTRGETVH